MGKKVLVIAAYANEEVLGCGGVIARLVHEGNDVHVLVVAQGSPESSAVEVVDQINREMLAAHTVLGVRSRSVLDFTGSELGTVSDGQLANAIKQTIYKCQSEIVYSPYPDNLNANHLKVHMATLGAIHPNDECPVHRLLCYEIPRETDGGIHARENKFIPMQFVNISNYVEQKLEAMTCYESQLKEHPHVRSLASMESLARLRGVMVHLDATEAFMVIRDIIL